MVKCNVAKFSTVPLDTLFCSQQTVDSPLFGLASFYAFLTCSWVGHDSSVVIATVYGLDCPGIECRFGRDLFLPLPNQPPIQWVPHLSRG